LWFFSSEYFIFKNNESKQVIFYYFLLVAENILHIWALKLEDIKVKGMPYILNPRKDFGFSLVPHTGVSHVI